jgi:hypothetical protein
MDAFTTSWRARGLPRALRKSSSISASCFCFLHNFLSSLNSVLISVYGLDMGGLVRTRRVSFRAMPGVDDMGIEVIQCPFVPRRTHKRPSQCKVVRRTIGLCATGPCAGVIANDLFLVIQFSQKMRCMEQSLTNLRRGRFLLSRAL